MEKISLDVALKTNAWPFQEAKRLLERFERLGAPAKGYALFETGYGPSGLPHIGTFGEVFRTTLVRRAFEKISGIPTKLFAFSDDMDGLRKVPDNIPNKEMVTAHLGKPLTAIPDPFGTHESFGHHMNARLRAFLDAFGFEYQFMSATECYRSGMFDATLLKLLNHYDAVQKVMLPTLGEERQATYSPFLPVCPETGKVLQAPVTSVDAAAGTITYTNESGKSVVTKVTGGACKLQWKPDWGMRWAALGVDYEMHGKDLIPSADLSAQICKIIGGTPPELFRYELFLDEQGAKISKSKGNGLSLEEWLTYGTKESLGLFMYHAPQKAKRLYFDVIPKHIDEYLTFLEKLPAQAPELQLANPAWHMHAGTAPVANVPVSFSLLLNLACACDPEKPEVLWGYIAAYAPGTSPTSHPQLAELVEKIMAYYRDFVKPNKQYRAPSDTERLALRDLADRLEKTSDATEAEVLQTLIYDVGKAHGYETNMRDWFVVMYEVLLGQNQGPRMGSFIRLYGRENMIALIRSKTDV